MRSVLSGCLPSSPFHFESLTPLISPLLIEFNSNLQEYAIASSLFYAMLETAACETSQRVMAMDNATTNAMDMVHGLSLIYNRARQAKITTELSEIIGGASAAEVVATSD